MLTVGRSLRPPPLLSRSLSPPPPTLVSGNALGFMVSCRPPFRQRCSVARSAIAWMSHRSAPSEDGVCTPQLPSHPPLSSSSSAWQMSVRNGWGAALHNPACAVATDSGCLYVHGGRIPRQQNAVSSTLIKVPLTTALADLSVLYTEEEASGAASELSQDPLDARGCLGPARYGHVAVHYGAYVVVHGGRDAHGVAQNDVHGFHLQSRRWALLKHVMGGCAPPRLSGHCITPLDSSQSGVFLVVGTEHTPGVGSTSQPRPKRLRDEQETGVSEADGENRLCVFRLDLGDFQRGWSRVRTSNAAIIPALERIRSFTSHRPDDAGAEDEEYPTDPVDTNADVSAVDLFVLGERHCTGRFTASPLPESGEMQLWRLTTRTGVWRQITLCATPLHTGSSVSAAGAVRVHTVHEGVCHAGAEHKMALAAYEGRSEESGMEMTSGLNVVGLAPSRIVASPDTSASLPALRLAWTPVLSSGLRLKRSALCLVRVANHNRTVLYMVDSNGKVCFTVLS